jgi:hypothetical protein
MVKMVNFYMVQMNNGSLDAMDRRQQRFIEFTRIGARFRKIKKKAYHHSTRPRLNRPKFSPGSMLRQLFGQASLEQSVL